MSIEAMKQALSTLEGWANHGEWVWPESALETCKRNTEYAIPALRQAIAEAERREAERIRPKGKSWLTVNPEGNIEMREIK